MTIKQLDLLQMGERIRRQRELHGMTRELLAEKLDVSTKFIADVERGSKGMSLQNFYLLIQILDISADYLLSGDADNHHKLLCEMRFYIE
ncbi:helix-turn-helix domain-containing protein [Emergencia timonensis]|uniref:helix-turn-helix domain-containing protein n=2 Tax=Bacillota TaxID=1239 RepID=UPI001D070526|nr:helix-turn-helix transcriptional regulator [Emergencia timonensis]MCB6477567.1 helix-turn-helix domain-containing protein [Emergencia timonensis]